MADWATIRAQTNEMRGRLFDPLSVAATNITRIVAEGIQSRRRDEIVRLEEARRLREEERQARREADAGAYADLARLSAAGPLDGPTLRAWLEKNRNAVGTTAAAAVIHHAENLRKAKEEGQAFATAYGVPYQPGLDESGYRAVAERAKAEKDLADLAPVLEMVRAGKGAEIGSVVRTRFRKEIGEEEDRLAKAAKQAAEEDEAKRTMAALIQLHTDPTKMSAEQKALTDKSFARERTYEDKGAREKKKAEEIAAVEAATPETMDEVAKSLTTAEAGGLMERRRSFLQGVKEANDRTALALRSGGRAETAAAISAANASASAAERALDEVAPRDPFSKQRVPKPGMEKKVMEYQATIDNMAAHIADLQKKGPGAANPRLAELRQKVKNGTASAAEANEYLDMTK